MTPAGKATWGGRRQGAGRPAGPDHVRVEIRITPEERDQLRRLGGTKWIQRKLKEHKMNVETAMKNFFYQEEDESAPEKFVEALRRAEDPKFTAGLAADEIAEAKKEIRALADVELDKRAADYLADIKKRYDDPWQRFRAYGYNGAEDLLDEEDADEGWWSDALREKIAAGVYADWAAVKNAKKYVFESHSGVSRPDFRAYTLEEYCEHYDLTRSDELPPDFVIDFDSKKDALEYLSEKKAEGALSDEEFEDLREEVEAA